MRNTFNLINNFWTDFEVYKKNISHVGGHDGFCQCETEDFIKQTTNPVETRSFLMIGLLIDQSVRELYLCLNSEFYEEFRFVFTYPRLQAHFDGSENPSSWFCYHVHGYDKKLDWLNVEEVSKIIFLETKNWFLEKRDIFTFQNIRSGVLRNITMSFRANLEAEKLKNLVEKYF